MSMFRWVLIPLFLGATAAALHAQQADDGLAELRGKQALTEEERGALRQWIGQRITPIVREAQGAGQAFAQLRAGFAGSDAFKTAYVEALTGAVGSAFKKAPLVPATRLVTLMGTLADNRVVPVLLDALEDDRTAVRAAGAVALRSLQAQLAGEDVSRVVAAIRDAAKKENSRETLQLMYHALDYSGAQSAADRKLAVTALLDVLQTRAGRAQDGRLRAEGADHAGLRVAEKLRPTMSDSERSNYVNVLARLLQYGVRRYATGENPLARLDDKVSGTDMLALRYAMELLILEAEQQLRQLVEPATPPQVAERMMKAETAAKDTEMIIELNKWAEVLRGPTGLDLSLQPVARNDGDETP